MITRSLEPNDIPKIRKIWESHYKDQFDFPDFTQFVGCAVVVDDNDNIITAGGIRLIPEVILFTDKNYHAKKRWEAINSILDFGMFVIKKINQDSMHAFVTDTKWEIALGKIGFNPTKGKSLIKFVE